MLFKGISRLVWKVKDGGGSFYQGELFNVILLIKNLPLAALPR